jgi:hypothetical protein
MQQRSSATYVYCVVQSPKALASSRLTKVPRGLEGTSKPRALDAGGGYHALVTTAPLDRYDAPVIDSRLRDLDWVGKRAAEHEAVVEFAGALGTVIPMKLFTIFASDERAIENVRTMKKSLDRVVERIAGCEEWGLRILFDETRAAALAREEARAKNVKTGKDFLLRKKALVDDRRASGARSAAEIDALYRRVAKIARHAKRRSAPNRDLAGRVLLDAVFLVPRPLVKDVRKTVTLSAEKLVSGGFDVSLTGPWPAYSFIGAR